jgi:hypothetical protein
MNHDFQNPHLTFIRTPLSIRENIQQKHADEQGRGGTNFAARSNKKVDKSSVSLVDSPKYRDLDFP